MGRLEDELRDALRRSEPPEGFEERVLARAAAVPARRSRWSVLSAAFRTPMLRLAWAAGLAVVLFAGARVYQERQERIRGERAKEEVVLALRITAEELQNTLHKVHQLSTVR